LKIVWLCNYSLYYLKDHISIKADAGKFHPTTWIHYLIAEVEKYPHIDLHIVTTSPYIEETTVLKIKNITYHIVKSGVPFIRKGFPSYFRLDVFTHYFSLKTRALPASKSFYKQYPFPFVPQKGMKKVKKNGIVEMFEFIVRKGRLEKDVKPNRWKGAKRAFGKQEFPVADAHIYLPV